MANRKAMIKQDDLRRYLAAVVKAGLPIGKISISPTGTVTITPAGAANHDEANPCDRLID